MKVFPVPRKSWLGCTGSKGADAAVSREGDADPSRAGDCVSRESHQAPQESMAKLQVDRRMTLWRPVTTLIDSISPRGFTILDVCCLDRYFISTL